MAGSSKDKQPVPLVRDLGVIANLTLEGRVFSVCNPTLQTEVVGQTSLAATLATVYIANLGARALMPLWGTVYQGGTVAGARIEFSIKQLKTSQFTSGTSLVVTKAYPAGGFSSQVDANHTATLPAFTAGNLHDVATGSIFHTVSVANAGNPLNLFPNPGSICVAPGGGLAIYINAGSTGPGLLFSIGWAELDV